jgi:hypothetical protein
MWNFLKRFKKAEEPELHDHPWGALGMIGATGATGASATVTVGGPTVSGKLPPPQRVTVPPLGQGPGTVTIAPTPDAMLSIKSDDGSIVIECNDKTIIESWDTKEAMVDRPIGSLGFADGIAYIMTRDGWVNMGIALEKPLEMTDRRGAIKAQKARKQND